ncbi:hypothetical protein O181_036208 [Austropuccinia psidii MF-1]|uniref:Uncharacterized protein n=1 Tax=Austropuccinia psidii MF-1 TaxID=1389203 RepID=A0A9Q3H8Z8_9BASI|nr:hypothetical protein [Austropuccinia psidii MF-1]
MSGILSVITTAIQLYRASLLSTLRDARANAFRILLVPLRLGRNNNGRQLKNSPSGRRLLPWLPWLMMVGDACFGSSDRSCPRNLGGPLGRATGPGQADQSPRCAWPYHYLR